MPLSRNHHLDNLRTALTALVILHHASAPYGGIGQWPYTPSSHPSPPSLPILVLNILDQTFFMAAFFLLSGYFSSASAAKKCRRVWLREKAVRLGVPAVVYSVLGQGVVDGVMARVRDGRGWGVVWRVVIEGVRGCRGVRGPVWYCAVLVVFDVVYAALRPGDFGVGMGKVERVQEGKREEEEKPEKKSEGSVHVYWVLAAISVSSTAAFAVRIWAPVQTPFVPLNLRLGYLPQYVLFYSAGIFAHRHPHGDLNALVTKQTRLVLGRLITPITAVGLRVLGSALMHPNAKLMAVLERAEGGWNAVAFLYAVWNECMGVLIVSLLLHLFAIRECLMKRWAIGRVELTRYSYAAFLVHAPIVVFVQCLLDRWVADAVLKSLVVGVMGCVGSWVAGLTMVNGLEQLGIRGTL